MLIPLPWFAFPVNALVVLTLLFVTYLLSVIPQTEKVSRCLASDKALLWALLLLFPSLLLMGFIPQHSSGSIWNAFSRSWYMALIVSFLFIVLISKIIDLLRSNNPKNRLGKLLLYVGAAVLLTGIFYGAPDEETYQLNVSNKGYNNQGIDSHSGQLSLMPFGIQIKQLEEEKYPSGNTRQVTALISLRHPRGESEALMSIGHPARFKSYHIHLKRYQERDGVIYGSLLIVRNRWQWFVYIGMVLLCAGIVISVLPRKKKRKE